MRCPRKMPEQQVREFVKSKRNWIQKHLADRTKPLPHLTEEQLRQLALQTKQILPSRVAHYARLMGVTYGRITVRNQRTRWGSCSGKGNLNFNCLLALAPVEIMDYVIVHELCHLKHMNHSKAFWDLVGQIMPDYEIRRKWLKDNGSALMAGLKNH